MWSACSVVNLCACYITSMPSLPLSCSLYLLLLFYPTRLLVTKARKIAQQYYLRFKELIPVSELVQKVASVMQEYTQSGWVVYSHRSLSTFSAYLKMLSVGVCVHLVCLCWYADGTMIGHFFFNAIHQWVNCVWLCSNHMLTLQGAYFPWKATAMGKNYINGKTFLEKRYIICWLLPSVSCTHW